jgi:hypothetical protein
VHFVAAETHSAHHPTHLSGGRMKTLRITAALLLALTAAACSASPTGASIDTATAAMQSDGTGYMGGGTRQP